MATIRFRAFDDAAPALAELRALGLTARLRLQLGRLAARGAGALRARGRARRRRHLGRRRGRASPIRRSSSPPSELARCSAAEALYVGDTPAEDVAGARAAGIPRAADRSRRAAPTSTPWRPSGTISTSDRVRPSPRGAQATRAAEASSSGAGGPIPRAGNTGRGPARRARRRLERSRRRRPGRGLGAGSGGDRDRGAAVDDRVRGRRRLGLRPRPRLARGATGHPGAAGGHPGRGRLRPDRRSQARASRRGRRWGCGARCARRSASIRSLGPTVGAFVGAAIAYFAYIVAAAVYSSLLHPHQKDITRDLGFGDGGFGTVAAALLIVVAAPVSEEIFFRGFIFGGLRRRLSFPAAALISAAIFGVFHYTGAGSLGVVPQLAFLGFALAWVYEETGSIYPDDGDPRRRTT